jgi:Transposase
LAEEFIALVRTRAPERLDPWLVKAQASAMPIFRNFAKKLETDVEAVRAAVSLPWSNGPVEGQISRLKMLKRQMYGRANLDLLNRRFLLAAVSPKVAKNLKCAAGGGRPPATKRSYSSRMIGTYWSARHSARAFASSRL